MKSLMFFLGIVSSLLYPCHIFSQCAGSIPPTTKTYDTIVYGNGNSSRVFSFPKFNPALGTLLSADLKSVVGLEYSYTLENQRSTDTTFKSKVQRTDDIYSDALDPSSINILNATPFTTTLIPAHQTVSFGPTHMNYTIANSVTDGRLINFMGAGTIDFDYETGSSAVVQGSLPWNLNFTSVKDTTRFSVTYRYCASILLSTGLLSFSAVPRQNNTVLLTWRQTAVEAGRVYHLEVSVDGLTFTSFSQVSESGTGSYAYNYLNNQSATKLFFRIRENNVSGETKYSATRMVEFGKTTDGGLQIIPTLYTGGDIQIRFPVKSNWQVKLYASDGRKISENRKVDAYTAALQVPRVLGNGVYIVETVNLQSQQRLVTRIIVQR